MQAENTGNAGVAPVLPRGAVRSLFKRYRELIFVALLLGAPFLVAAAVIAVSASPHSHTLRIAKGELDGVVRGAAVVSADGIVGTVAQTTSGYADVQLITSPLSAVPALSQRTRSRSTVKGIGDITRARLEYALRTDDLQEGDVLLTEIGRPA